MGLLCVLGNPCTDHFGAINGTQRADPTHSSWFGSFGVSSMSALCYSVQHHWHTSASSRRCGAGGLEGVVGGRVLSHSLSGFPAESNDWLGYWGHHMKSTSFRTIKEHQKVGDVLGYPPSSAWRMCWEQFGCPCFQAQMFAVQAVPTGSLPKRGSWHSCAGR